VTGAGPAPAPLLEVLSLAREQRLLGPGPLDAQITHATGFASALAEAGVPDPAVAVDLGSGGGLPGLVLAHAWPSSGVVLVEASARRAQFLTTAVASLGLERRVTVLHERAELVGRDPTWRAIADVVTARSFGAPAVVAECAAPLLRIGGHLVVSEPPASDAVGRWPDAVGMLGLEDHGERRAPAAYRLLVQVGPCPDRFPRRPGTPERRPLF
jgi:16S rRNA (guanine527-N7)-methyltransferase